LEQNRKLDEIFKPYEKRSGVDALGKGGKDNGAGIQ
jgi:hypothetical protein